VVQREEEL